MNIRSEHIFINQNTFIPTGNEIKKIKFNKKNEECRSSS